MKTTNYKIKIERAIHQIDATDQILGRLAGKIAGLLHGKGKVTFTPQVDNGDFVVVSNTGKLKVSGKKAGQKTYKHHSGYPGGLKITKFAELFDSRPELVLKKAVYNMLPKNRLREHMIKRLTFKK